MLKPLTATAHTSVVSAADPAIDIEASDMDAYGKDVLFNPSCWREHLKIKPGDKPTVFVIGVIPPDELARINDETERKYSSEELRWRSFMSSVRDIENWPDEIPKRKIDGVEYVEPKWLRTTFVRGLRVLALDIGLVAYMWNQLTETETKN